MKEIGNTVDAYGSKADLAFELIFFLRICGFLSTDQVAY